LEPVLQKKRNRVLALKETVAVEIPEENEVEKKEPDYDETLLRDVTKQDLRKIFCGLCRR